MDKSDLDFLIDSGDINLLYKYILKAIPDYQGELQDGIGGYTLGPVMLCAINNRILYKSIESIHIGKVDKYVELR